MVRPVDYDDGLHRGYERGRELSPHAISTWRADLERRLPPQRPLAVLDLGSGTGRMSELIAQESGGPVYAVEPSRRMRAVALAEHPRRSVHCLAGHAEAIPLATARCDAAVLFFVLHHLTDLPAAARELSRVLRPRGRVLVVGSFADRLHPRTYHHYLPRTRQIESDMFAKLTDVVRVVERAGLGVVGLDEIEHEIVGSLGAYRARLGYRAVSTFEHLSEDEIADGLSRLAADAAAETQPHPIRHVQDMLTLTVGPQPV